MQSCSTHLPSYTSEKLFLGKLLGDTHNYVTKNRAKIRLQVSFLVPHGPVTQPSWKDAQERMHCEEAHTFLPTAQQKIMKELIHTDSKQKTSGLKWTSKDLWALSHHL